MSLKRKRKSDRSITSNSHEKNLYFNSSTTLEPMTNQLNHLSLHKNKKIKTEDKDTTKDKIIHDLRTEVNQLKRKIEQLNLNLSDLKKTKEKEYISYIS